MQVYLAANAPIHKMQAVSVTSIAQRMLFQIVFFMVKSFLSCVAFYLWHLLSEVVTAKIIRTKVIRIKVVRIGVVLIVIELIHQRLTVFLFFPDTIIARE